MKLGLLGTGVFVAYADSRHFGGGFTGGFAGLAVAVVISAGCMVKLAREGF